MEQVDVRVEPGGGGGGAGGPGGMAGRGGAGARHFVRAYWVDIAWALFVGLNLIAMRLIPAWQTVPFLIIWLSLTTIYGFRLWHLGSTVLTVAVGTLATVGLIGWQALLEKPDGDTPAADPLLPPMV